MDFTNLFLMQEKLNDHISKKHNLSGKSLLAEKLLALQVEIAELANETRCFKFWSVKGPSTKTKILEEYVDCLHFLLSIGLDKEFNCLNFDTPKEGMSNNITNQFLNLYIDINDFIVCSSKDHYQTLFEDFLYLGISLNFTEEEIEDAYYIKNNTNHKRQAIGY